ncbi:hypothetical protein RA178_13105 [Shewanella oncorhynchi]|uniref:DUF6980 domain-containing protein n=1 Tax=Shewanella oncorhynchi TaxID=2726434 RepID=A0AA50KAI1_9GAMM|nr:hypothetical protein [Shewanella oncorhynchi]WMB71375.1 hypothetical protein RA178_13105 [Shewanella oncorhynchi]
MNKHCCQEMEEKLTFTCKVHRDEFECPDSIIRYTPKFDEYGLIIHDGGSSSILINYCPWCGVKLPESKRDLWFDTLEQLGFDSPTEQEIPSEFKGSLWYEERQ